MRRRRPGGEPAASSSCRRRRRQPGTGARARPRARAASSASKPHGAMTISSGCAARTTSQVVGRDGSPALPSTSMPPASSIISGSQCPAEKGGSIHSAKKMRRRGSPRTASAAASIVAHMSDDDLATALGAVERFARARGPSRRPRSACADRARACSLPRGTRRRASPLETAQTAQRSWVTIRSGSSASIKCRVDAVQRRAVAKRLAHCLVDLEARERRRIDPRRRDDRLADDLGRPAALVRHTDERVDQAELRDDLGRTRQQRADAHDHRL